MMMTRQQKAFIISSGNLADQIAVRLESCSQRVEEEMASLLVRGARHARKGHATLLSSVFADAGSVSVNRASLAARCFAAESTASTSAVLPRQSVGRLHQLSIVPLQSVCNALLDPCGRTSCKRMFSRSLYVHQLSIKGDCFGLVPSVRLEVMTTK